MEWTIFALSQMFIITVAVSTAFWLRMRAVNRQNAELRQHLEEVETAPAQAEQASPEEWVQTQIDGLDAADPLSGMLETALAHLLNKHEDLHAALLQAAHSAGLLGDGDGEGNADPDDAERIAELERELEAAREQVGAADGEPADDRNEELKSLLQQFTRDSREMMACIQTLEAENAQLREQLGLDTEIPTAAEDTEDAA